jgi:xanthosine utilization system XapX-like protein
VVVDATATAIADAVDRHGILLVHDQVLPSVTALVTGAPVSGSWWSHPMANTIYGALGTIDDEVATVKLVNGKQTLVARRLWPDLVAVGAARDPWQTTGLDDEARALLADVESGPGPLTVDKARRRAAEVLERRLLVYVTDIHTEQGHHVKGYEGWQHWARGRHVTPTADRRRARQVFEDIAAALTGGRIGARLPW